MEWNQYIIQTPSIARGSYSKVYYGVHKETKIEIALKKIWFSKLEDPVKEKIISEIHILQQMKHPHLLKIKEYKCNGEFIYIVLEYCNQTMAQWLLTLPSIYEKMDKIKQIVSGIKYMHQNNIIHRDIKLENILLQEGIVKICDFGFSKEIQDHQLCHTICGTPLYMSPEILHNKSYSYASDIWSLGILCFEIIHGHHPFGKPNNIQEYRNQIMEPILFPPMAEPFKSVLVSMLHIDPYQRPPIETIYSVLNEDSDDEDVTGRGKTNRGFNQAKINTEYFTPPDLPATPPIPMYNLPIPKPSMPLLITKRITSFFK